MDVPLSDKTKNYVSAVEFVPYCEESYRLELIDVMTEIYDIRVKGHLDSSWTTYFDGLEMTRLGDGTTRLIGPILDQPALLGLLMRIASLGLPILAVKNLDYARHKERI